VSGEGVSFADSAAPVEREAAGFSVRLAGHKLTATMRDHFATEEDARRVVEEYLRAWRALAALAMGRVEFEFSFDRSEIVDRNPEPGVIHLAFVVSGTSVFSPTLHAIRGSYPDPPDGFALDPDTETLFTRWQGYVEGREPLESMAYACLTILEIHGGRPGAAKRFGISEAVLRTLARLSSETGDRTTARKITAALRPRTDDEQAWLEAAVKVIVRRAGKVAAAPRASLPQITMGDLPPL
jgi:hypothetical protein